MSVAGKPTLLVDVACSKNRLRHWLGLFVGLCLIGCAGSMRVPAEGVDYGLRDGFVWVRGPWEAIAPSKIADEVIDQLCPAVMQLPRAQGREHGLEWCGAIYSLEDGNFYASMPSPLGPILKAIPEKEKRCKPPYFVEDPRGETHVLADFHGHPWPYSRMSAADRTSVRQLYSIRIQFDTTCRVMKLVPHIGKLQPGELYERRGQSWLLIGIIKPEHKSTGIITPVDE
jgi:hypothetical protein